MKLTCALFFLLAVASNWGPHFFTSCSVDNSSVSEQTYRVPYLQRLSELIALSSHEELSDKRAEEKNNLRKKREDNDSPHTVDDSTANDEKFIVSIGHDGQVTVEKAHEENTSDNAEVSHREDHSNAEVPQWEDEDENYGTAGPAPAGGADYEEDNPTGPMHHEHYGAAAQAPAGGPDYGAVGPPPAQGVDYHEEYPAPAGGAYHGAGNPGPAQGGEQRGRKLDQQAHNAYIRFFSQKRCIHLPGEERSLNCRDMQGENDHQYDIKVTYNEKEEHINGHENKCLNLNINDGSPPSKDGPSNIFINLSFVPNIPEEIINDFYAIIGKLKYMFEIVEPEQNSVPAEQNSVPTEQNSVPAEQNSVPTEQNSVPTEQNSVPTEQNSVPADRVGIE
ncbi:hypothetical protein C922_04914 [Plasmodium inui San Antonio 1]|uniref:Uncharacterized protein n=1 Tax=Plasmodium inui San Antonio 1 TaxID=1237626 RepID=W6ZZG8_9APIC|nr:hypothetical protein C922_04914 [Plasmodium inui San Antonio 1]EUD64658.1 hypothetical protein C922_04914 [Plasmodium inui San Antonio 1]